MATKERRWQRWTTAESAAAVAAPARTTSAANDDYPELRRRIRDAGLMRRQPRFYAVSLAVALALVALAGGVLLTGEWYSLPLGTVVLAIGFGQLAFLAHDGGHRQIFSTSRNSRLFTLLVTFLLGVSINWWVEKHNRHHSFPNALGVDPDVDLPVLAFSPEDAARRRGVWRFFVRYQSYLFVPILALEGLGLRLASAQYLWRARSRTAALDAALVVAHMTLYMTLLVLGLGWTSGLMVALCHHLLTGIYLGSIFAPNHKGMELIERGAPVSFLRRQVLTSRNISAHALVDWMYGGQNFQIEHHLFPSMPRNHLREAQRIVRQFCAERGLPYTETSILGSYREILSHLHFVGSTLRVRRAPA